MLPLLAHGVGGRADLPVDAQFLVWGASLVLVVSFAGFGVLWTAPKLRAAAERTHSIGSIGTRLVDVALVAGRIIAAATFVITVAAALTGSRFSVLNPAPWVVFIAVWTAMPILSFLLGDLWRHISPLRLLGRAAELLGRRLGLSRDVEVNDVPAAIAIAGFLWLELAYHAPDSPRVLGWLIVGYSVWAVVPALWLGVQWTDSADGLGWWFTKVSTMAPWRRAPAQGSSAQQIELRTPTAGLSGVEAKTGTVAAVLLVLGGSTFDGFGRTDFWTDIAGDSFGWGLSAMNTLGLIWIVLMVSVGYIGAARSAGRLDAESTEISAADAFLPSLIPIAFGYGIAHTFSLLVFEGQTLLIRISDPFGNGSDWFGTNTWIENYTAVSTNTIAWVQVGAIVIGHVIGVMVAHDRALERHGGGDKAIRSQYAMLLVMVAYTIAGLLLLVQA